MAKLAKAPATTQFETRGDNNYMAFLADLRAIVSQAMAVTDVKVKGLAGMANLNPRTVRKFLAGDTIAPQLPTVYRILGAVNIALTTDSPQPKRRRRRS